jgi:O-acetyl-ADP-ribose deacetylase (regulator of RNase III)
MTTRTVDGVAIECVVGDITRQDDIDAVVNAANAELRPGGGVAGAIHRAAGPELDRACRPLAPIRPGEAVATDAYALPNRRVIHCLGPVYGSDEPAAELLAACYKAALTVAEAEGSSSIAFPALSTGAFGYPLEDAAEVALATCVAEVPRLASLRVIRFVLFDRHAAEVHDRALERATGAGEGG